MIFWGRGGLSMNLLFLKRQIVDYCTTNYNAIIATVVYFCKIADDDGGSIVSCYYVRMVDQRSLRIDSRL